MKRTFKYYLKLKKDKKKELNKVFKVCCWLHNYLLEQFRERDENKEIQPTKYQLINSLPQIKKEYPFLKNLYSTTLQEIAKQVYEIWKKYKEMKMLDFKKKYPNFKPIHRYNSFINSQLTKKKCYGFELDNSPLDELLTTL